MSYGAKLRIVRESKVSIGLRTPVTEQTFLDHGRVFPLDRTVTFRSVQMTSFRLHIVHMRVFERDRA